MEKSAHKHAPSTGTCVSSASSADGKTEQDRCFLWLIVQEQMKNVTGRAEFLMRRTAIQRPQVELSEITRRPFVTAYRDGNSSKRTEEEFWFELYHAVSISQITMGPWNDLPETHLRAKRRVWRETAVQRCLNRDKEGRHAQKHQWQRME